MWAGYIVSYLFVKYNIILDCRGSRSWNQLKPYITSDIVLRWRPPPCRCLLSSGIAKLWAQKEIQAPQNLCKGGAEGICPAVFEVSFLHRYMMVFVCISNAIEMFERHQIPAMQLSYIFCVALQLMVPDWRVLYDDHSQNETANLKKFGDYLRHMKSH